MSELYTQYADEPFQILAFPCDQWMHQEPFSNLWIEKFVRGNGTHLCGFKYCEWKGYFPYPLFAKCNTKPEWCAKDPSTSCTASSSACCSKNDAVWKWLNELYPNDVPSWNFAGKHLFNKCGTPVKYINNSTFNPADLMPFVDSLLAADDC